jgi:NADH-quinone oxidoreductase subunit J
MNVFFYIPAAIAIIAALICITRREVMHGILYLIVVLISLAIMFFQLGAPFVAAMEIIVYAGAIVVLFLFVVMMINPPAESGGTMSKITGLFAPLVLVIILALQFAFLLQHSGAPMTANTVGPGMLGKSFFSDYAYTLHLIAVFLLVGLVGALHLSTSHKSEGQKESNQL